MHDCCFLCELLISVCTPVTWSSAGQLTSASSLAANDWSRITLHQYLTRAGLYHDLTIGEDDPGPQMVALLPWPGAQ